MCVQGIPNKGKLLTALSLFFFDFLASHPDTKHIPNHVITSNLSEMPSAVHAYADQLEGRAIWVRRAQILPVEAIVRGYITGSAWGEYQKSGTMHGIKLQEGMKESTRFEPAIFTPSTKAEIGDKDENIHPDQRKRHPPGNEPHTLADNLADTGASAFALPQSPPSCRTPSTPSRSSSTRCRCTRPRRRTRSRAG